MIDSRAYFITVVALGLAFLLLVLLAWFWAHRRRQRMAREVEQNEALFDAFFNAAPAGMAILDRELNFVRINPTLAALMQFSPALSPSQQVNARQHLQHLSPTLATSLLPSMTEVLVSNQPVDKLEVQGELRGLPTARADSALVASWLVSLFPIPTAFGRNPVGLGMVVQDIAPLKASQQALEQSRATLRRLGAHREQQVEGEYRRLAREFHDELGQLLTTARIHLKLLGRQTEITPEQLAASVQTMDDILAQAYHSIKAIAADLRPPALNLGLVAAIEWLVERMLKPIGVQCELQCQAAAALKPLKPLEHLEEGLAITAFRIVQEALSNVVRHAQAQRVQIQITHEEAGLKLQVADDGQGFDMTQLDRQSHFGLLGMMERVAARGGNLHIDTAPGAGTRLEVWLPGQATSAEMQE